MMLIALHPKFPLGQIVITSNALSILSEREIQDGVQRHASADWGNVGVEDAALNDRAVEDGSRLLSAYGDGSKRFWIITESDRSVTTILMPEDY
jgi:hypothetical protein